MLCCTPWNPATRSPNNSLTAKSPPPWISAGFSIYSGMPVTTVIFDLDGTLIDSIRDITNALNYALRPFSVGPLSPGEAAGMIGEGAHKLVERVLNKYHLTLPVAPLVAAYTERYASHLTEQTMLYPGAVETLKALARYRIALVSNKTAALSQRILDYFGLGGYFEVMVCADTIPQRKPLPDPLLHVLTAQGVPVAQAVMVGDSEIDIMAGKACSMRTIAVTHGYGRRGFEKEADFVVDSLPPVVSLIESLS